jgi:hypothetical protein
VTAKTHRLRDGTDGTEWEALTQLARALEMQRLQLDERIAEVRRKLETAEGRP